MSEIKAKAEGRLTEGSVLSHMLRMAFPMSLGLVAIMMVDLVDAFWIAQIGENPLIAIGFAMPITSLFMSIGIGLSTGASMKLAQMLGDYKPLDICQNFVVNALIISVSITFVCVVIGILSITSLFSFLGASGEVLSLINDYMFIWYLGMTALVVPMVGNGLIRATGDSTWPSIVMISAAVLNAILDPILIFGIWIIPPLGIEGAALATVIVRTLAMIAMILILHFKLNLICWKMSSFAQVRRSFFDILDVSASATLSFIITPIANTMIVSIIATIGLVEVAGFNIGIRIEMVALVFVMGVSASVGPIMAQNFGANAIERLVLIRRISLILIASAAVISAIIVIAFSNEIAQIFDSSQEVEHFVILYLSLVPLSWPLIGVSMCSSNILNATRRPMLSFLLNISRVFVFYVPLAYGLKFLFGFHGILYACILSGLLSGIYGLYLSRIGLYGKPEDMAEESA